MPPLLYPTPKSKKGEGSFIMATSSNERLISDLPLHIFDNLVPKTRVTTSTPAALRLQIVSKLQTNAGDGTSITRVRDVVRFSSLSLLRILDPCLINTECNRLLSRIHSEGAVRPQSALAMHPAREREAHFNGKMPTGLQSLDDHLRGGLPIGSVAEIVGRAGVGKTHLAQQLCVLAHKFGGGSIYIDAENKLSVDRLGEIAFERIRSEQNCRRHNQQQQQQQQQQHQKQLAHEVLENVSVHRLITTNELLDRLDLLEDEIILRNSPTQRLPVRLIVIDSVAAPIRRDFDMMGSSSNAGAQRASALFKIAKRLKQLAHDHKVAVVVVNQVGSSSMFSRSNHQRNNTLDVQDGEFVASLGTAWQYCVTTRIVLEHDCDPHRSQLRDSSDASSFRMATLAKSVTSKRTSFGPFQLTKCGMCDV
ncbi:hypothetical protein ACHAWF_012553 [Thalassiosira exigua]